MNDIIDKLVAMENDGFEVTFGSSAYWILQKLPLAISIRWSNVNALWTAERCGAFSESIEFNTWEEFPAALENCHQLMKTRVAQFLGGSGI
jgi:hypothetical protein